MKFVGFIACVFAIRNPDPSDPNLADVDKIFERFEAKDARKELRSVDGIDGVMASSIRHNSQEDNAYIQSVLDDYSEGKSFITKPNAKIAAGKILGNWNQNLSDKALKLYVESNFNKVFEKYDMAKNGKIDDFEQ